MRAQATGYGTIVILLVFLVAAVFLLGRLASSVGSAAPGPYVYVNTYVYSPMTQVPASVSWSFGSASGGCTTNVGAFNPGVQLIELDASGPNGQVSQAYSSPSRQNVQLAICEISLTSVQQQTSTTSGTLSLTISAGGYYTQSVSASLLLPSKADTSPIDNQPLIITIPLTSTAVSTTTATTSILTTSSLPTTISTTTSTTSVSTTTSMPTTPSTTPTSTSTTVPESSTSTVAPGATTTIPQGCQTNCTAHVGILQEIENFFSGIGTWFSNLFNTRVG